jgi:hypothetical protein
MIHFLSANKLTVFATFVVLAFGCGQVITPVSDSGSSLCALADDTSEGAQSSNGCHLLTRDTSSCEASRTAQGLSGFWLKFSCRVTLTKSGSTVTITADSQPDYTSPYFATTNSCYSEGFPTGRAANPNTLAPQNLSITVPYSPTAVGGTTGIAMPMGVIGVALNGVAIFSNAAAPGDSIYAEVATFDKCEGHPAGTKYHYHTEPTTASDGDENFIGVMRDGFPAYGRYDSGGVTPTLNMASTGAHLGTTVDSPSTAVNHYHVNLQTSGSDSAYFITSGYYLGTAGSCTGC